MKLESIKNGKSIINSYLQEIKRIISVELTTCDYFAGLRYNNGNPYFNILVAHPTSLCDEYVMLQRLKKSNVIKNVEPNGHKRLAIYI